MRDKNGNVRTGTLPPGSMSEKTETRLKQFLEKNIPGYYAEMVNKTQDSYIQVIYTLELEKYFKDRMCLIGDAGMVIQPFTGSGVFKGYNNAKDLIECLRSENTLNKALEKWSDKQVMTGKRLLALGEQMESAFIWKQLDFANATEEDTKKWWNESVTFPENFSYARNTK
jgi:2-polyprenyl-6-methoxyphenol hydroxylase-like FAD-dependent oxidoreductase